MTERLDIAVIGGDGIGPEVTDQALRVMEAALPGGIAATSYPFGATHYLQTGQVLGDEALEQLSRHDAILLGAVGGDPADPRLAGGVIERGLLLRLRFAFDHYVNLRPAWLAPGVESPLANPGEVDFLVVREGTEGPYAGNGGSLRAGTAHEIANEVSVNTARGVERTARYAFERARARSGRLTLVHKKNVLTHAGALWQRIVDEVAAEYPEVTSDYLHVDAATIFLATDPGRFDVILTDNLFGDIITDLAAAVTGGIGLAASGNLNPSGSFPSMFEPVHGSAPDIAGTGAADPTAAILSAALLLEHAGRTQAAASIERAVREDLAERDAPRTTSQVGDAVIARLRG